MLRPPHVPFPVPRAPNLLQCKPVCIKRHLAPPPGTAFAQTGATDAPRPGRYRAWPLPLSKANASPSWGAVCARMPPAGRSCAALASGAEGGGRRSSGARMAVAMSKTRRAPNHFSLLIRLEKAGRMATETPSPEYKILEDSAGVQHVSHKDGKFYIEVRTSGWREICGEVYRWDNVGQS